MIFAVPVDVHISRSDISPYCDSGIAMRSALSSGNSAIGNFTILNVIINASNSSSGYASASDIGTGYASRGNSAMNILPILNPSVNASASPSCSGSSFLSDSCSAIG
jgi:hypothetical protein